MDASRLFTLMSVLAVAGCAGLPVTPPDDQLARMAPHERSSLLREGAPARLLFHMGEVEGKAQILAQVFTWSSENGRRSYRIIKDLEHEELAAFSRARAQSTFHSPVQVRLGNGSVWCVHDRGPIIEDGKVDRMAMTLEVYSADPRQRSYDESMPFFFPESVFEVGRLAPDGSPMRSQLRIGTGDLTEEVRKRHSSSAARGAWIAEVDPLGPAARAGLMVNDVIVAVNGTSIEDGDALLATIGPREPGSQVELTVQRGAAQLKFTAVVEQRGSSQIFRHNATVVQLGAIAFRPDGSLESVRFETWKPALSFILAGKASRDLWGGVDAPTEHLVNDALVEWKNQELPSWLRAVSARELTDQIVVVEKGVLALDVQARVLKDAIDAEARKSGDASPALAEAEQLIEQRKMLLGVVLGAMKAAVQRPASSAVVAPSP